MTMPKPRIPSPGEIVSPLVGIETSVIGAVRAPFSTVGLNIPSIPGPVSMVSQVLNQLPRPPQPPDLPNLPSLGR